MERKKTVEFGCGEDDTTVAGLWNRRSQNEAGCGSEDTTKTGTGPGQSGLRAKLGLVGRGGRGHLDKKGAPFMVFLYSYVFITIVIFESILNSTGR
jgi:hypothetical protein